MTNLIFNYPSTAKIRIKKTNLYQHDSYPCVYRIYTQKLDFLIPRNFVILGQKHIYIPLDYYKQQLAKYYLNIKN